MEQEHQIETISCPNCLRVQDAIVYHLNPWNAYVHECIGCGYIIMESEWEEVKKPTSILKKPYLLTGRPRDGLVFECDNECRYNLKELSAVLGMKSSSFSRRLKEEGWAGEDVLRSKGEKRKKKIKIVSCSTPTSVDVSMLGSRKSKKRLKEVPGPSLFELAWK